MNCRRLFNVLHFYWLLLFYSEKFVSAQSNQLEQFLKAYENAQADLKWIDETKLHLQQQKNYNRQKRHSNHREFNQNSTPNKGDIWYDNFRRSENKNTGPSAWKITEKDSFLNIIPKLSRNFLKNPAIFQNSNYPKSFEQNEEFYEKDVFETTNQFPENNSKENDTFQGDEPPNKHNADDYIVLEDQPQKSKNDLSDEADEKLSKFEQDNMDNHNLPDDYSHNSYPLRKRNDNVVEHVVRNPDHEIKLKISNKMIARGMGPSLPSDIYGEGKKYYGFPALRKAGVEKRNEYSQRKIPNYNLFKRNSGRKLLGYDYDEYTDEDNISEVEKSVGKIENFGAEDLYELFDEKQENCSQSLETSVNKTTTVKPVTHTTEKLIKTAHNPLNVSEETTTKTAINNKNKTATNTTVIDIKSSTITPPAPIIKLKLDFVLNQTNLMPANLINGTFETSALLVPSMNMSSHKIDGKSIKKRETMEKFRNMQRHHSAKRNENKRSDDSNTEFEMAQLISGELPNKLMLAILQLLQCDENLKKTIGPTVEKRKKLLEELYAPQADNAETLNDPDQKSKNNLKNLMKTLNYLIEEQVYDRTCVKLPPDLDMFYDQLMQAGVTKSYHDESERQKRQTKNITRNNVKNKYEIISMLLEKFQSLKTDEKEKYQSMNDSLHNYLKKLDEVEFQLRQDRRKRSHETVGLELYNTTERPGITEKFIKLMKMAEFMKTDVLLSEDDDMF